jgi:pimeloyl-ACP methyl ester carboxylesterase
MSYTHRGASCCQAESREMNQVTERTLATRRIATNAWEAGVGDALLLVHGNLSNGAVWREQLALLPPGIRGIAPDLRGFGRSEAAPIDATRGVRDFADDLVALLDALDLDAVHVAGHSLGGGVALQLALDHPERVRSLALVAPISPHGFGGTHADGTPCAPDFAGSGGGAANPELVRLIAAGERGGEQPLSPRATIRTLFFPTPQDVRDEELLLEAMLETRIGEDHYPGDALPSEHWPAVAPGGRGVLNAISPRWCDLTPFADAGLMLPVLWVRGDQDAIVGDASLVDFGQLGALGIMPDWPGAEAFPPQPMVAQTRALLERHAANGGSYREEVLADTGHFAFTQRPREFATLLHAHLKQAGGA